jgi:class 3 adenylate cyclase/DNA-binding SARP family transcriptional activator/regulation of enolase protein 1 (concanavalin A-like superfamily)
MSSLKLFLLGPPRVELEEQPVEIKPRKALGLLIYLAITGESHPRDSLATLFWPEADQRQARAALRRRLSELNQTLGREWLQVSRESVGLEPGAPLWVDVAQFQQCLARCQNHGHLADELCNDCLALLTEAVTLYRNDFLTGFTLPDCPDFDDWQFFQSEGLRQELASTLEQLVHFYRGQADPDAALPYARRWLTLDPLHEPAHQQLMLLYAQSGQQAAALRQYQLCVKTLEAELDVPPSEKTTALYERIRRGELSRDAGEQGRKSEKISPSPPYSHTPAPLLPAEDEIRLVTVLFADMSRSVELTWDLQPEETADLVNRLLKAMMDIVARYEGRIDRLLGDGLLAIFGAPQAHEDDPERALQAALDIQTAAQDMGLGVTVGLNTGAVYFGQMGFELHRETTVMGPVVNLASRLQSQAAAGQTLVGEATYRQTRRAFRFSSLSLNVKGISEPVSAYRLVRPRRQADKSRGIEGLRAELIGRDEELSKLKMILGNVCQGQGQMVSLIGEAGVGKSRLVAESKQLALTAADGTPSPLWLQGRCLEMSQSASYWPFIDLLRAYFAWGPDDDEPTRAGRVVAILQGMVDREDLSVDQFDELGPLLGNLLSLRFGSDWDERLKNAGPQEIRHRTFQALYDFFLALARQGPLVLILEDLHWADSLSVDLISHLMEALPSAPLLLLCVYRPEREHKCWRLATIASRKCPAYFAEIRLRELTPQQSRQLIESLLVIEDLPDSVIEMILAQSQGNPFFVEEVIHALIDAELVYRAGEVWRARAEIERMIVPKSVQSVIQSRLDRLEPELKQVLQWASVMGRSFRPHVLAQITPSGIDLEEVFRDLEDQALVYQEETVPEEVFAFKHVLTQETVYQTILRRRRAEFHWRVAETMEQLYGGRLEEYCEQLAYHYNRAVFEDSPDAVEKAVKYLLQAGAKARRAYLNQDAISYFERALDRLKLLPAGETAQRWQFEALKGLGQAHTATINFAHAETCLREAIALGREMGLPPRQLVRLYCWLGDLLLNYQQRHEESLRLAEEGLALLADDTESPEAAMMNAILAYGFEKLGNVAKYREYGLWNAQFAEHLPYSEELRLVFDVVWQANFLNRDVAEAARWRQVWKERATENYNLMSLAEHNWYEGEILAWVKGKLHAGLERGRQASRLFQKIGDAKRKNWSQMLMGWIYLALGDLQIAEQTVADALEATKTFNEEFLPNTYHCLGIIYLAQGELQKAEAILQKALGLAKGLPNLAPTDLLVSLGHICLAQGKRREAAEHFQAAVVTSANPELVFRIFTDIWVKQPHLVNALSGLEAACEDPAAFRAFCHNFQHAHPGITESFPRQWYLESTQPDFSLTTMDFGPENKHTASPVRGTGLIQSLKWEDPIGDCAITVQDGVEILAPNGRDLWYLNWSAPRLLRPVCGDFVAQITCLPASAGKPAIGGLCLWKDKDNFLCLERGSRGPAEIRLAGCLDKQDVVIGRGHLSLDNPPERVYLRLERLGQQVKALCRADSERWFSVGQVDFPVEDPVEVGLYAVGNIDRLVYPGAFPEGTAIRFESFQVWGRKGSGIS